MYFYPEIPKLCPCGLCAETKEHEVGMRGYGTARLLRYPPALFSAFLHGNLICLKDISLMHEQALRMRKIYSQADRLMLPVIWAMFVMALALANWHDTLGWALAIGLPAAI